MNAMKVATKYVGPIVILILLFSFIIYAAVKENFADCKCPEGSMLKNGGCYTCEKGYRLSTDYYNSQCISENPNDYGTSKYTKVPLNKSVVC